MDNRFKVKKKKRMQPHDERSRNNETSKIVIQPA